jgi:hypothetical protein
MEALQGNLRPDQLAVLMEVFTTLRGPANEAKGNGKDDTQ